MRQKKKTERRTFIGNLIKASAGIVAAGGLWNLAKNSQIPSQKEIAQEFAPEEIYTGTVEIKQINGNSVNWRTKPEVPRDNQPIADDNVYTPDGTCEVNGTKINFRNKNTSFTVKNAEVYLGDNPDATPEPGKWLVFEVTPERQKTVKLFVFWGESTSSYVTSMDNGEFAPLKHGSNGQYATLLNGETIMADQMNQISLLPDTTLPQPTNLPNNA